MEYSKGMIAEKKVESKGIDKCVILKSRSDGIDRAPLFSPGDAAIQEQGPGLVSG